MQGMALCIRGYWFGYKIRSQVGILGNPTIVFPGLYQIWERNIYQISYLYIFLTNSHNIDKNRIWILKNLFKDDITRNFFGINPV